MKTPPSRFSLPFRLSVRACRVATVGAVFLASVASAATAATITAPTASPSTQSRSTRPPRTETGASQSEIQNLRSKIERAVYRAIVASFLEKPRQVERYRDFVTSCDLVLMADGRRPTGCADDLARLWAESLATPGARAAGYERVLERATDLTVERSLRAALRETRPTRIRQTRSQDRWNRWAGLFNSAARNLGRLAGGQIGGGVRFALDLIFSRRHFTAVTDRQRKEWWLIDNYLRANPDAPGAARLRERMAALETRFQRDAVKKAMRAAHFYADRGWWHEALFYVRAAREAGYRGERKFRRQVLEAVADERRGRQRSLEVADTEISLRTQEEVDAYTRLLEALTLGDLNRLKRAVPAACDALADTSLADEAEDALSIIYEWSGDRRKALEVQHDLALRYPEETTGKAARVRLSDPQYNARARFDREMAKYRARQRQYVLTGNRSPEQQIELLTRLIAPSVPELGAAGAFFVTDIVIRSLIVSLQNPISPARVLEAGEQLLARPGNLLTDQEKKDIQVAMGVLFQKLRRYDEAAGAYREANVLTPEFQKKLAETAADQRYRRILQIPDLNRQVLLLDRLVEEYPQTDAAARAGDLLDRLRKESKVEFEIPYEWLREDPAHWGRLGARVRPEFIDGLRANGELNERGLVFWRDRPASATFVLENGRSRGYINLTPPRRAALRASAETWADERIALDMAGAILAAPRFPFEIHGSVGGQGVLVFPTLQEIPLADEEERKFR